MMLVLHDDAQREFAPMPECPIMTQSGCSCPVGGRAKQKAADGINPIQLQRGVSAALSPQAQPERDPARPSDDQIEGKE